MTAFSDVEALRQRLSDALRQTDIKQDTLSLQMGRAPGYISDFLRQKSKNPRKAHLKALWTVLFSLEDQNEPMQAMPQIPEEWSIPLSFIAESGRRADAVSVIRVTCSNMLPDYKFGDAIVVDHSDRVPSPPGLFVLTDGESRFLSHCMLLPDTSPQQVQVSSHVAGPAVVSLSSIRIVARVIAHIRRI